ncbi:MAG: ribosome maturation factor RimM [Desulfobacteraceae bacterium]|nr:ribosome maturation factor RimM [Desulfobacteraceae bacterium]
MNPGELLLVGKIVSAHGIKGEVKVYSYVDQQSLFNPGRTVFVEPPAEKASVCTITSVRVVKKNSVCIGFEAVSDRSRAEALIGSRLLLPRSALPPPEPDTWYWCDLIGLDVYDSSEGFIGRVAAMIETGANDVLVVRDEKAERLVPAIETVVRHIDLREGRILVDLPEGL